MAAKLLSLLLMVGVVLFLQEKKSSTPPPTLRNGITENCSKPKISSQSQLSAGDSTSLNTSLHMNLPGKLSNLGKVNLHQHISMNCVVCVCVSANQIMVF